MLFLKECYKIIEKWRQQSIEYKLHRYYHHYLKIKDNLICK